MISIEMQGKTPEEAIRKALDVLGVPREKVKMEILEEGSKGLFGMIGSKQAKIKATLLEIDEPKPGISTPEFTPRSTVTAVKPPRPIIGEREAPALHDAPAKEILEELLNLMGFHATVDQETKSDKIILTVQAGEDSSILIGRRGKNLNGLQYVVNRICSRKNERVKPIVVDIEGYRERRKDALESLARRLAAKVKSSRREVETEPLSASDRRLIHMALKDDGDVHTQSRGDGPFKNVVIKPKRENNRRE
jgi:spoIIIJ-associated protein